MENALVQKEVGKSSEVLSVLTGETGSPPESLTLPKIYQTKNERFQLALQAQQLLAPLPDSVTLTLATGETHSNQLNRHFALR